MKRPASIFILALLLPGLALGAPVPAKVDGLISTGSVAVGKSTAADSKAALEVSSTTKGFLPPRMTTAQRTAISSPPAGLIVFDTDLSKTYQYSGSAWVEVGSGAGGGGLNYASANPDAETDLSGWATFADGASLVDGTGGSPTAVLSRVTTTVLEGNGEFGYSVGGAFDGVSFDFTINREHLASILEVSFSYELSSYGNYTCGPLATDTCDLKVAIYDKDAGALIPLIEGERIQKVSGPYKHVAKFQTHATSDDYRLIIYQTTAGGSYSLTWDSVKIGPQGSQTLAASPTIASKYFTTSGQTFADSTSTTVVWGTKDFDSHGSTMNTSTGVWTAPENGLYELEGHVMFQGSGWNAGGRADITANGLLVGRIDEAQTPFTNIRSAQLAGTIRLLAGQTLSVVINQNSGSSKSLFTASGYNWISIKRVGNY